MRSIQDAIGLLLTATLPKLPAYKMPHLQGDEVQRQVDNRLPKLWCTRKRSP
jgi:hypothetical protein